MDGVLVHSAICISYIGNYNAVLPNVWHPSYTCYNTYRKPCSTKPKLIIIYSSTRMLLKYSSYHTCLPLILLKCNTFVGHALVIIVSLNIDGNIWHTFTSTLVPTIWNRCAFCNLLVVYFYCLQVRLCHCYSHSDEGWQHKSALFWWRVHQGHYHGLRRRGQRCPKSAWDYPAAYQDNHGKILTYRDIKNCNIVFNC